MPVPAVIHLPIRPLLPQEWQNVEADHILPPNLQTRSEPATGQKQARLAPGAVPAPAPPSIWGAPPPPPPPAAAAGGGFAMPPPKPKPARVAVDETVILLTLSLHHC